MAVIREEDVITSLADALQYISYFYPMYYTLALGRTDELEESSAKKHAIAQILTNSRMCDEGGRSISQYSDQAICQLGPVDIVR